LKRVAGNRKLGEIRVEKDPVIERIVAGWPIGGWALATVLYVAVHALDLVVTRLGNGAKVFGVLFKALGLLVVLLATAASDKDLAISAVLTYALAYTAEFGLSLASYYGREPIGK